MAASIYVVAGNGTLASIKAELASKAENSLKMAELGVEMGKLLVPEGKTIKDLAEALRKAKAKVAEAVASAEPVAAPAEPKVVVKSIVAEPVKTAVPASVVRAEINSRYFWKCENCGVIARKLRLLAHQRTCACRS
jgi:hypothetical protein